MDSRLMTVLDRFWGDAFIRSATCMLGWLVVFSLGCGRSGDLPFVSGNVTLDGVPVQKAVVSFFPTKGRAAIGKTDEDGFYVAESLPGVVGVAEGKYRITISTWQPSKQEQGIDAVSTPEVPEMIPKIYASFKRTKLSETVQAGENVFDFALKSRAKR